MIPFCATSWPSVSKAQAQAVVVGVDGEAHDYMDPPLTQVTRDGGTYTLTRTTLSQWTKLSSASGSASILPSRRVSRLTHHHPCNKRTNYIDTRSIICKRSKITMRICQDGSQGRKGSDERF